MATIQNVLLTGWARIDHQSFLIFISTQDIIDFANPELAGRLPLI